jgi:hypothetical protein
VYIHGFRVYTFIAWGLLGFACLSFADVETRFTGTEGFVFGKIDKSGQPDCPLFKEVTPGSMYLPKRAAPSYGTLLRNPNVGSSKILTASGLKGWNMARMGLVLQLDFTFEGLPAQEGKQTVFLANLGISSASDNLKNPIYFGIQKPPKLTETYQVFIITGQSGGFISQNVPYSFFGDSLTDADDLSSPLQMTFRLIPTSSGDALELTGVLVNRETKEELVLTETVQISTEAYKEVFGFFGSSGQKEEGNYDLLNVTFFSFKSLEL